MSVCVCVWKGVGWGGTFEGRRGGDGGRGGGSEDREDGREEPQSPLRQMVLIADEDEKPVDSSHRDTEGKRKKW